MAQYIDTLNKTNPTQGLSLEIENLVENEQKEEALQKTIAASVALSSAPERGLHLSLATSQVGYQQKPSQLQNSSRPTTFLSISHARRQSFLHTSTPSSRTSTPLPPPPLTTARHSSSQSCRRYSTSCHQSAHCDTQCTAQC